MSAYKNCQSCGMPMKKDTMGGGTNADGSKNEMYCSKCYSEGQFTSPNMSAADMQSLVKGKLQSMGFPGFIAGWFTKGIPNLARWNKSSSW
ncbi:MAG: zinc ribbon domain-containing protein [Saprospiraceae bacterium]|nr:zinc ribbon domain-containing protein [Saprospiraceae bacterium]MBK7606339.1 zinc ribbon domain-containing protein [Saprospiraceae bacterium]MBK8778220.1 zinc ribbon domain-containing protein [Saprospiraceae bacterium]MBK9677887.1 zinc ribbon domain-containing protein [Saprospiraceae bacterium]MBK9929837.1 zinc ribbon domain-containing protein [Saprospiraceae bacterium]